MIDMDGQRRWTRGPLLLMIVAFVLSTGFAMGASMGGPSMVAADQTQTQPQNQTGPAVAIDTTNNTTAKAIHISEARLPSGGFVAIHDEAYIDGVVHGSEITVSKYLSPGTHHDIQIPVNRSVPGGNNVSRLNATKANLTAVLYRDTNNNHRFDFATSFGETDVAYQKNKTEAVSDTELITFEANQQVVQQRSQPASASLRFNDQQLQRSSDTAKLTLAKVTLSKGGFVAVHDQRYLLPTNNPVNSTVGLSRYLTPGTHRNVTIQLLNGSVEQTKTLVAIPYLDTNDNQRFDYVKSGGETDYAYLSQSNSSTIVVNQTAKVQVPATPQNQSTRSSGSRTQHTRKTPFPRTSTALTTATKRSANGAVATDAETDTSTTSTTVTATPRGGQSTGRRILGTNLFYIVGGIVVVGIAVAVIWSFERRS